MRIDRRNAMLAVRSPAFQPGLLKTIVLRTDPFTTGLRYNTAMPNIDKTLLKSLFDRFNALEASGAGKPGHADHDKRNEILDEMQDAAGLAGRMVMERDILRKAEQILKAG